MPKKEKPNSYFAEVRDRMYKELSNRKLFVELRERTGVSQDTVLKTFKVESETGLSSIYLKVWNAAIELIEEANSAANRAIKVLEE